MRWVKKVPKTNMCAMYRKKGGNAVLQLAIVGKKSAADILNYMSNPRKKMGLAEFEMSVPRNTVPC